MPKDNLRKPLNKILLMIFCLVIFIAVCFIPIKKATALTNQQNYLITCYAPGRDTFKPMYEFESSMFKAMPSNYMLFIKEGKNFTTNLPCTIEVQ